MRCQDAGVVIAGKGDGVIDKTNMETQAIKAARRDLAETLNNLGLMPAFHDRSATDIDAIIEACVDGFQGAMVKLAAQAARDKLDDEIPF